MKKRDIKLIYFCNKTGNRLYLDEIIKNSCLTKNEKCEEKDEIDKQIDGVEICPIVEGKNSKCEYLEMCDYLIFQNAS